MQCEELDRGLASGEIDFIVKALTVSSDSLRGSWDFSNYRVIFKVATAASTYNPN